MRTNEELVKAIQNGQKEELLTLWEQCYRFICLQAIRWKKAWENRPGFEVEDLTQSGYFALCAAVQGYEIERGMSFIRYLVYHLKREFSKVIGCYTPAQSKEPLNSATSLDAPINVDTDDEITLGDTLPVEETGYQKVEEALYQTYASGVVREAVRSLPDRQRIAIEEHYFNGKSYENIGKEMHVSQTTACNYAKTGMQKLRKGRHAPTLSELLWGDRNFYRHTGYTAWKETGCSVQEWLYIKNEEQAERYALKDAREAKIRYCINVRRMSRNEAERLFYQ